MLESIKKKYFLIGRLVLINSHKHSSMANNVLDSPGPVRAGERLDWQRLEKYLKERVKGLNGTLDVQQFHGGHANLTYLVRFENKEFVLRRPPFGKIAPGAHDMKREFRVLSKLNPYYDPAPKAYHYCSDENVIGAPFVLLERRHGIVIRRSIPDAFLGFEQIEKRVTTAMIRALSQLHLLDTSMGELSKIGRPDGYLSRQLEGWNYRWSLVKGKNEMDIKTLFALLEKGMPQSTRVSVVHHDIKLDNCQFQPDNPDVVSSIFDWDMTTLGDPLSDFATTLSYWPDPSVAADDLPALLTGNFPDKSFLRALYSDLTGFDLTSLSWYESFAFLKSAIIALQLYKRYTDGETNDSRMLGFGRSAKLMTEMALQKLL